MGRFQPFHTGHLRLVEQALQECDDLIIAVTGSQFNYIRKDPFTAGERIEMVRESLMESGVDPGRYLVLGVENQPNVYTWLSYLRAALPRFDAVYSGNPYVAMLLADSGVRVIRPNMVERERFNATLIRRLIAGGGDWRELVPDAACRIIDSVGGVDRIRTIMASDTDPTTH